MKRFFSAVFLLFLSILPAFAVPVVYVDSAGDFTPSNPANGTTVTWKSGSPDSVSGLTFGTHAFSSVQAAINAVDANGTVFIAADTYKQGATLTISKNLTLQGDGAATTLLSGNSNGNNVLEAGEYRVLDATGAATTVTIRGLSIVDGQGSTTGGTSGNNRGGGINNAAILTLEDAVVARHTTASGAGIANSGTLTLVRCVVSDNHGGGISNTGLMTINQSTISSNFTFNNGAGISTSGDGETTLNHSLVTSNNSNSDGAGISNILGATTVLNHSEVRGNTSATTGGGISNQGATVRLNHSTISLNRSNGGDGGAGIHNLAGINSISSLLVANDSTIAQNIAPQPSSAVRRGGGILNDGTIQMNRCQINANQAGLGAGIYNRGASGSLTITGTTFNGNIAGTSSGFGIGGGLFNENQAIIRSSTFSQNRADYEGGAILNYEYATESMVFGAVLDLENSTLSGNQARSGAGIYNSSSIAVLNVVHCTVTGNTGVFTPGINNAPNDGTLNLTNSIVAGNIKTSTINPTNPDLAGTFNASGNNIIGIPSGLTINDLIQPLSDNGGPTFTHALPTGSPAIDSADNSAIPAGVTTDQRGAFRSIGPAADIGSYEVGAAPSLLSISPPNGTGGFSMNDTITLTADVGLLANPLGGGGTVELRLRGDDSLLPSTTTISGANIIVTLGNLTGIAPLSEFYLQFADSAFISAETGVPLAGFSGGSYFTLAEAVYVHQLATDFAITTDQGSVGLDVGDTVTWKPGTPDAVAGLIFGADAFLSIQAAIDAVVSDGSGIIRIAAGLYKEGVTITVNKSVRLIGDGPDATEVNGNADSDLTTETGEHRVFLISGSSRVVGFENLAINNGQPPTNGSGGGIFVNGANDLTIRNARFANNRGTRGAAISNSFSSDIRLFECVFTGNRTSQAGGALFNSFGRLVVERSTFNTNQSNNTGGGAFYMNTGTLSLVNSTLSGNTASGTGSQGGAIYNDASSQISVFNSTIVDNQAATGGGFWLGNSGTLTLANSVVAGNRGLTSNPDIRVVNAVVAGGVIFIGDLTGSGLSAGAQVLTFTSGQTLGNLMETTLADNGGPTRTHQLVPGSPLIDAGLDSAVSPGATTDQRGPGYPRFQNTSVDIGAVEYIKPPLITAARPAGGSRDFDGESALVFTFDENILAGTGSIGLFLTADNSPVPATVAINASTLTITPDSPLPSGTAYHLIFEPRALSNLSVTAFFNAFQRLDFTTAVAVTYVDAAGDFTPANPTNGQTVTWNGASGAVTGLTFGTNAFTLVQDAVDAVIADGTVNVAAGNYAEGTRINVTKSLTLQGDGADAAILSGEDLYTVFEVSGAATEAIFNDLAITKGFSSGTNSGGSGIRNTAVLTLNDCTLYQNVARNGGGAIASMGADAVLTINRSTLSNNTASNEPINAAGIGGAILNTGTLNVNNSTLSGNHARNDGGAINNQGSDSVVVIHQSTIVGNDSDDFVGGIYTTGTGSDITLNNSIIAGNTAASGGDLSPGSSANITFAGVNFIGNITNITNFRPAIDLTFADGQTLADLLNPTLADNGGSTQTHALRSNSPAEDAGDNSTIPSGLATDQRGYNRIIGGTVDIGAYEAGSPFLFVHQLAGDFTITTDQGNAGLDSGDTVTWNGTSLGAPVPDLVFGTDAFVSVAEAITVGREGATIHIATGSYQEGATIEITKNVILQGDGANATRLSGAETHRVLRVPTGVTANLQDLAVIDGRIGTIEGGAGIFSNGTLVLKNAAVADNWVTVNSGQGGGIYQSGGSLTITGSLIAGNTAGINSNASGGARGGGVYVENAASSLSNSTLSGNRLIGPNSASIGLGFGTGLYTFNGNLDIAHCTITGNTGGDLGGAIAVGGTGTKTVINSILAGNPVDFGEDTSGSFVCQGVNFIGIPEGSSGFRTGTDMSFASTGTTLANLLNPTLADNGGPTQTHALVAGSLAINAGVTASIPAGLPSDQRGFPRVIGTSVDIGAFELLPALETAANSASYSVDLTTKISIADLLASLTGGGGLPLTLVSIGDPANAGSSVRINGGFIVYTPAPGQTGGDSFTYEVTDGFQSITGTMQILPATNGTARTFNIVRLDIAGGSATVVAAGIPGQTYHLESSEDLGTWTPRGTPLVCPGNGIMHFPDPGPLPDGRFYRIVDPRP